MHNPTPLNYTQSASNLNLAGQTVTSGREWFARIDGPALSGKNSAEYYRPVAEPWINAVYEKKR